MAFPIATPAELIGQLYVGYFGRAADPVGLDYWVNRFNDGMSLLAIANSFAVQPEATSLYDYLAAPSLGDPVAFITAIYHDLFNRDPDSPGLAYWVHQLTVQGTPPGQMVLDVISGAQGSDVTTIQNKTHVAVGYAQAFLNSNVAWNPSDNIASARAVVASVTHDPATVVTTGTANPATVAGDTVIYGGTDMLLIDPSTLALPDAPVFIGVAVDYGQALALLAGGGAAQTQAVYQLDDKTLWIDADNNGLLNALDIRIIFGFGGADIPADGSVAPMAGITVSAIFAGIGVAFESGLMTNPINGSPPGVFAAPIVINALNVTADDTTTMIAGSYDDVTVVGKSGGVGIGETVWLVHDPQITTGVIGVDLRAVEGPTAVYNTGGTQPLSIIGGVGTTNILIGGSAADTIVAKGTGPGFGANFIWGGLGGDIETGAAGGAAGDVGTVFLINDRAESPGNAADGTVVHITNFRGGTDTLLINPAALALGDVPVFIGDAVDYGNALALLAGGFAARTQAVYQLDDQALWIDVDNNGLLNALDIKAFVDFSGPGFLPGALDFGNLLGLFDGRQATTYIEARLALPASGGAVDLVGVIPGVGADSLVGSS